MTRQLRPPALDPLAVEPRQGSIYPEAFKGPVQGRSKRALGRALGLESFGPDIDLHVPGNGGGRTFTNKRGEPY